ncbi:MAG TPA: glycoside hydrolase family 3 C-terminal domain-containing protein [Acidobacteriaceae bacterium]|jgi:beta-glucosidase|nr:glycoside hydrolase family 3 C-terminal domain-containing protein [Acidobacteriaceae bacterium]
MKAMHGMVVAGCALGLITVSLFAQGAKKVGDRPWMNQKLSPEQRAELVLPQLTLDEKIALLHGEGMAREEHLPPEIEAVQDQSNGGAGLVLGVPRLGIPNIEISDAAYGVRDSAANGRYSTALPSNLGSAASWDPEAACAYGKLIGDELRMQGYNETLGGGVDITRDPRNGRTFEYMGEDPVLAGTMVGARIRCEGAEHMISDIKHYALNDQESGRQEVDVEIGEKAMRESDLLAFEIGVKTGHPDTVMCSYNGVNGTYACENSFLLDEVLKKEWKFPGFVTSDWEGTHSTVKASHAGLDQEQPFDYYYGTALKKAVEDGQVSQAELNEHVRRVLWAEFASGIVDYPQRRGVVDVQHGLDVARKVEEGSAVLLRNQDALLPLDAAKVRSIAVIGEHADAGMISGGGSAQVDAPGEMSGAPWRAHIWFPTSPLKAIRAKAPEATVSFSSGEDVADAVKAAKAADVAVVFAWQWESEGGDLPNLSLPGDQDKLIEAVTAANPRTVVVLETGSAVEMPWLDKTGAVLESWYAGSDGAHAVANLLFGEVNPSGKLPMTFPMSEDELPRKTVAQPPPPVKNGVLSFKVDYNIEGAAVGYKWYEEKHLPVLFPFGFGLSYTTFQYSNLKVGHDASTVTLTVTNSGERKGADIAEVYAELPASAGEHWKRLIGYKKVDLNPGESKTVTIDVDPLYLSTWDEAAKRWTRPAGEYRVMAGASSVDLPLETTVALR